MSIPRLARCRAMSCGQRKAATNGDSRAAGLHGINETFGCLWEHLRGGIEYENLSPLCFTAFLHCQTTARVLGIPCTRSFIRYWGPIIAAASII